MEFVFQKFLFSGVCLVRSLSFQEFVFQEFVFQEFVFQEFVFQEFVMAPPYDLALRIEIGECDACQLV